MEYTPMNYQLHCGESAQVLKQYPDNHFDSIVCDPPYGISFLGKSWDANTGSLEIYQECIRVLKPGGHILAFSAARTYHHLAITLEQAGFEIRDQIMWIYGSGFPKSQDVGKSIDRSANKKDPNYGTTKHSIVSTEGDSVGGQRCKVCNKGVNGNTALQCKEDPCGLKYSYQTEEAQQWQGWGTQLKPAHEPIALARKPMTQTIAKNCQEWGVGALNIDATRVPYENAQDIETYLNNKKGPMERSTAEDGEGIGMFEGKVGYKTIKREVSAEQDLPEQGRFPANVIHDGSDEVTSLFPHTKSGGVKPEYGTKTENEKYGSLYPSGRSSPNGTFESNEGSAARFFYCPKVSRRERHLGHDETGNNHPTVKPIELMKYLIKLVTPKNGRVLDPFNGSGSTGCAAVDLGHHYTGIDLDQHYIDISHKRIQAYNTSTYNDFFEEEV
jgi:DNA modification methylase